MPTREKLCEFIQHVRNLTSQDEKGDDGFDKEYSVVKDLQLQLKQIYPQTHGRKECNRKKNRYKDIIPFDDSRVVLPTTMGPDGLEVEGSDYINASFLKDVNGERGYIAAMGPLTSTIEAFWLMVWMYEVRTIVMLCKEIEMGKKKCARYWCSVDDQEATFGRIKVQYVSNVEEVPGLIVTVMEIEFNGRKKTIHHYQYEAWPDHGVPESAQPIVELIQLFRRQQPTSSTPVVVHCSAGCGRTGTVCAVDYAWQLLQNQEGEVDVLDIVKQLRHQRLSMVQTKEQYVLIYKAVLKLVKVYLTARQKQKGQQQKQQQAAEDIYQNVCAHPSGISYGQQAQGLGPKKKEAPPVPYTARLFDNDEAEEERRLLQQMTVASRKGSSANNDDEELSDNDMPPSLPVRTELSKHLVENKEPDTYASVRELIDTSDHWATAQRRFEGKQPTKLNDDDAPPPVLPTRTSESFQIEPAGGDDAMPSSSGPRSRRPALTSTEKKNLEGHRTRGNKFGSAARDGRGGGTSPPSATTPTSNSNRTEMPEDLGFKNRVPRPRGPRPMPSNWRTFQ